MPFSAAQQKTIDKWMAEKGAKLPCPACGQNDWVAHGEIALPATYSAGNIDPSTGIGMIVLYCSNCAHVRAFAAAPILGAL